MSSSIFNNKVSRRKFIRGIIIAIISFEFIYILYNLISKKNLRKDATDLYSAGNIERFENNTIYPFLSGRFYLSKLKDGGILAISVKCTHLGCIVQADIKSSGYSCPCHSSKFNKYGEVMSLPAIRALDILPVIIKNGNVLVDTQRPLKRQKFETSQLTYA